MKKVKKIILPIVLIGGGIFAIVKFGVFEKVKGFYKKENKDE